MQCQRPAGKSDLRLASFCLQEGVNIFEGFSKGSSADPAAEEAFMAGILRHLPGLQAFTTPSPVSYERIKPGCWSGAYQ